MQQYGSKYYVYMLIVFLTVVESRKHVVELKTVYYKVNNGYSFLCDGYLNLMC